MEHIIEILRNGDQYHFPQSELESISKFFAQNDFIVPKQCDFIKLNVGGGIFYTTIETLNKAKYFNSIIKWKNSIP